MWAKLILLKMLNVDVSQPWWGRTDLNSLPSFSISIHICIYSFPWLLPKSLVVFSFENMYHKYLVLLPWRAQSSSWIWTLPTLLTDEFPRHFSSTLFPIQPFLLYTHHNQMVPLCWDAKWLSVKINSLVNKFPAQGGKKSQGIIL